MMACQWLVHGLSIDRQMVRIRVESMAFVCLDAHVFRSWLFYRPRMNSSGNASFFLTEMAAPQHPSAR